MYSPSFQHGLHSCVPTLQRFLFFYKAHILAGQIRPANGATDFVWLTKEEIKERVAPEYWEGVKDMLSDF